MALCDQWHTESQSEEHQLCCNGLVILGLDSQKSEPYVASHHLVCMPVDSSAVDCIFKVLGLWFEAAHYA